MNRFIKKFPTTLFVLYCLFVSFVFTPNLTTKAKTEYDSKRPNIVKATIRAKKHGKVKIRFSSDKKASGYNILFFRSGERVGLYHKKHRELEKNKKYTIRIPIPKDLKKKGQKTRVEIILFCDIDDKAYYGTGKTKEIKQK